ncbi:MAG: class I SAM-dependent methyltransferase [Bacteroidota bacterium]|nr:class I SAM-dependent methyltransferase [Bacteroidota bacterium]MDP3146863.1 class I SAM-dependent methyltransferase [Bacteroidota bacterium]
MRGFTNTIELIRAESINEKKYGITTSSIKKSNSTEFFHYQGAGYLILFRVLEQIAAQTKQFEFVDIGCGKGRPVFVAESIGYKTLTGIDLDGELISVAKENLKNYLLKTQDSKIQFLQVNALEYSYKNMPTVYFLFNPFNEEVLEKVLRKIISSTNSETWFVYMNPKYSQVFTPDKFDLINEVKTKRYLEAKIFRLKI